MLLRQLFDSTTSTFTYLLADEHSREAVLIDTVYEQHLRDLALLRELGLKLVATLETHVHADHVTGAWLLREATGSRIAVARAAGARGVDLPLESGQKVQFGSEELEVRATPGHTDSCLSFVHHKSRIAFSGDALLIRGAGRTDFQQGNAHTLYRSVREQLLSLPGDYLVYPGHDYSGRTATSVAEENAHNPRLGAHVREEDFVGYMQNLNLPHPKQLAIAVPANLECGRPGDGSVTPSTPDWGPVVRTYAGVLQIEPEWVHLHRGELHLLDVREPAEHATGMLGALEGAQLVPLSELRARTAEVPTDKPVVTVCPAGARSAMAASILEQAGVPRVANVRGGLLEWRALALPMAAAGPAG